MKMDEPTGRILFEEKQRFPRWLLLLVGGMVATALVGSVFISVGGRSGERELWLPMIIIVSLESLMIWLFAVVQLEKLVTSNGLYYRWTVLQKRYHYIEHTAIKEARLRSGPFHIGYSFYSIGYGTTYNMSLGKGMQLYLENGKKIFFGSAEPELFEKAIRE